MAVFKFHRKPGDRDKEVQLAARYEPGAGLDSLMAVAQMADEAAELAEVRFTSGRWILLVAWTRTPDDHPPEIEYETVAPGDWLAYSQSGDFLYDSDDAGWKQFYLPAAE
jgi:hypothetical protein